MSTATLTRSLWSWLTTDHGPAIRQALQPLAVAIAATYAAGYVFGQQLHLLNDRMAGKVAAIAPAPARPPVPTIDWTVFRVKELKACARTHGCSPGWLRTARKAEVIAWLEATT